MNFPDFNLFNLTHRPRHDSVPGTYYLHIFDIVVYKIILCYYKIFMRFSKFIYSFLSIP